MPAFLSPGNQPSEWDAFSYPQYELLRDTARDHADLFAMRLSGGLQPALFDDAGGASENIRAESISGRGFEILGVKPAMGRLIQPDDDSVTRRPSRRRAQLCFLEAPLRRQPIRHRTLGHRRPQAIPNRRRRRRSLRRCTARLSDRSLAAALRRGGCAETLPTPTTAASRSGAVSIQVSEPSQLRERLHAALTNFLRDRVRVNPPRNLHGDQLRQFTDAPLRIRDMSAGRDSLFRMQFRRPLSILALICALLLLVACSNVANLMIARASARGRRNGAAHFARRGRFRLIQQMLIESAQLAAAACALGLLFAALIAPSIVARLGSYGVPGLARCRRLADEPWPSPWRSACLRRCLFGVVPALRASSVSPGDALKAGGTQNSGRIGSLRWILAAQVGFSVAVLFLSGLLLLSFRKLIAVDLGFARDNVVLFDLAPRDPEKPSPGFRRETARIYPPSSRRPSARVCRNSGPWAATWSGS